MAIKELFFEGKTIEAAVENAAMELGEDKDLLAYTVEETPSKGIFGIGATPAKIKVEIEVPDEVPAPKKKSKFPHGSRKSSLKRKRRSRRKRAARKKQPLLPRRFFRK